MLLRSQTNMATLANFIQPPEKFSIGNDIEKFIKELKQFFKITNLNENNEDVWVEVFLSTEASEKYAKCKVDDKWESKLLECFSKKEH